MVMIRFILVLLSLSVFIYTCTIDLGAKKCETDFDCPFDEVCSSEGICIPKGDEEGEDVNGGVSPDGGVKDTISMDVQITTDYGYDITDIRDEFVDDIHDIVVDVDDVSVDSGCNDECNQSVCKDSKILNSCGDWDSDGCKEIEEIVCQNGCENGKCKDCTPDCNNKECGSDGCGGTCGTCGNNSYCNTLKLCSCKSGFGDCNDDPGDGCETDLRISINHCGICGKSCPANTYCEDSTCEHCKDGFANCDLDWSNGCETNLNSVDSCGTSCISKVKCSTTNGSNPVCDKGVCRLACSLGYYDCNIEVGKSDGCETIGDQNIIWEKNFGGYGRDLVNAIALDHNGNIYIAGFFYSGNINFDGQEINNPQFRSMGYLVKIDNNGNVLWTKGFKSTSSVEIKSISTDSSGNVYLGGIYEGILDIDGHNRESQYKDFFIAKYSSSGNYQWSKSFGSVNDDTEIFIAVDKKDDSIYALGDGGGVIQLDSNIINGGLFLIKFNNNGDHIWSKGFYGAATSVSIAIDSQQNIIITGGYESDIKFDGVNTLPRYGETDIYLAKFSNDGRLLWGNGYGGDKVDISYSVAVDSNNKIFITGGFGSNVVSFGNNVNVSNNSQDGKLNIFITRFDENGTASLSKSFGGNGDDISRSITVDDNSNIYITGEFDSDELSFGGDSLKGKRDIYVVKFDNNLSHNWSRNFQGEGNDSGIFIIANSTNLYITGIFGPGNITFGTCPVKNNGYSDIDYDIFLIKRRP